MEDIIDNTNRNFKGQMKTEEVLCFCRKHWITILPHLAGIFFGSILFLGYLFFIDKYPIIEVMGTTVYEITICLLVIGITYLLHRLFMILFDFYLRILIITNYRIVDLDKTVFFRDSRDAIDLAEIQDMSMKQNGIIPTLLGYGEIRILLSSVSEPRRFQYVPNPAYHFGKINKTKREYILKRQFAKQPYRPLSGQANAIETQIRQQSIASRGSGEDVYQDMI